VDCSEDLDRTGPEKETVKPTHDWLQQILEDKRIYPGPLESHSELIQGFVCHNSPKRELLMLEATGATLAVKRTSVK
jgi:hypothetical protein